MLSVRRAIGSVNVKACLDVLRQHLVLHDGRKLARLSAAEKKEEPADMVTRAGFRGISGGDFCVSVRVDGTMPLDG
jgi:hypothetical protein